MQSAHVGVAALLARSDFKNRFVARLMRAGHGKRTKKPQAYPPSHAGDFFAKFDEVAACILSAAADDIL